MGPMRPILGRIGLRKNLATLRLNIYQIKPSPIPPSSCLFFRYIPKIAIRLKRKLTELLMPKISSRKVSTDLDRTCGIQY